MVAPDKLDRLQFEFWQARHHRCEGFLSFHSGQRRPEAEMCSITKGKMPVIAAGEIKEVWLGKSFRVAVCGGHNRHDGLAFFEHFATHLCVVGTDPAGVLAGALVT